MNAWRVHTWKASFLKMQRKCGLGPKNKLLDKCCSTEIRQGKEITSRLIWSIWLWRREMADLSCSSSFSPLSSSSFSFTFSWTVIIRRPYKPALLCHGQNELRLGAVRRWNTGEQCPNLFSRTIIPDRSVRFYRDPDLLIFRFSKHHIFGKKFSTSPIKSTSDQSEKTSLCITNLMA